MKKYLISGMAALMFCGVFTSCTRDTDLSGGQGQQQKVMETYEQAFLTRFGQPAADQDWGFGSPRSNTRGSNDNKNQWGNPTYGNYKVPAPLTEGQSIRVKAYFQQHPKLTFTPPTYDTYFVQQVYKGKTSANEAFSKEYYFAANNDTIIGSGHMDKLTVGANNLHVDNFNYGTYNGGDSLRVLNTGATDENNPANFHNDMITLIEGVVPTCVGFHDSEGSVQHNDHAALVAASVIDQWATENEAALKASGEFGENVVDEWNRSFVGLDYESKVPEDIYLKVDGKKVNATISQCCPNKDYVYDGTTYYTWDQAKDMELTTPDGKKFPLIDTNSNTYLGERVSIDQNDMFSNKPIGPIMDALGLSSIYGDTNRSRQIQVLDLTTIFNRLGTGDYAAINNAHGNFVTKLGGRDYVFSDWIVTLTKAEKQGDTPNPSTKIEKLRVIAEDLQVGENTDFDFNDVVFDVIWTRTFSDEAQTNQTSQKVEIKLLAAGGTLPLYVDGKEVHEQFGVDQYTMVNTRAKAKGLKGKDDAQPVTWETSNYSDSGTTIGEIANSIDVYVTKNEQNIHLSAPEGGIASKIAVKFINDQEYVWCDERQDIEDKYRLIDGTPLFKNWVQGLYSYDDWYTYAYDEIIRYRNKLNGAQGN